jgi:hypothetical protein
MWIRIRNTASNKCQRKVILFKNVTSCFQLSFFDPETLFRNGYKTEGEYRVALPDGRIQVPTRNNKLFTIYFILLYSMSRDWLFADCILRG